MDTATTTWHHEEYLYGAPLFPAAPLSWLAPMLCLACGALASGGWTWSAGSSLRLLLGLLLAGPLLGTAWAGSLQLRHARSDSQNPAKPGPAGTIRVLPYTLPGSLGYRIASRIARAAAWSQGSPRQRSVWQWLAGSVFSLAVAAQLGPACLLLTVLGLASVCLVAWGPPAWSESTLLPVGLPVLLAWLLGHTAFGPLHIASALSATCYALIFSACALPERTLGSLGVRVTGQAGAAAVMVAAKQPVLAAAVALLATPQLLLAAWLTDPTSTKRYFGHIQWALAASLLLSALALGA